MVKAACRKSKVFGSVLEMFRFKVRETCKYSYASTRMIAECDLDIGECFDRSVV